MRSAVALRRTRMRRLRGIAGLLFRALPPRSRGFARRLNEVSTGRNAILAQCTKRAEALRRTSARRSRGIERRLNRALPRRNHYLDVVTLTAVALRRTSARRSRGFARR